MKPAFRMIAGLTGAVIAFESLALLFGTHLVARDSAWAVPKNTILIALDILGGTWLLFVVVRGRSRPVSIAFYVVAGILLFTHLHREWEYLAGLPNAFCANLPLFVFNNLRLAGLVATICPNGVLA
jgi:hypothetical protein